MRQILLVLTALIVGFSLVGLGPGIQPADARVTIINRAGQATTRITDGDTLRLQVTLSQTAAQPQSITFTLGEHGLAVGNCTVPAAGNSCQTDPFPSLGWHWDAGGIPQDTRVVFAYNTETSLVGQSDPLAVRPRPVVMVHGFISAWDTWKPYLGPDGYLASTGIQGFALGDGQVEGVLNTGKITDPSGKTNTIARNAEIEGQYIEGVKKATGAEMVDIVAHSMGGMISRYYIDRVMQGRDVAQLVMLGSPMGGTDCAVLPASLGFYLPATIEIRQSYMDGIFNRQVTHRHGVEFYDLGGTAILDAFKSPCTDVPNDTVVSLGSVNAIPLLSSQMDVIHSDLTISRSVFDSYVLPLLQKNAASFTFAPDPAPATASSEPLQFTRVYTGHVDPGASTELTINIEPNVTVASFALYDPTRSVTVSVRGANGNVIQLDLQTNGLIRVDDPSSLFYLGYGFANPKPGPWKVSVLATDTTPTSGADFSISVYFIGGATLNAQSSTLVPKPGEQVTFSASLTLGGETLPITQAQALIRGADGKLETLDFALGTNISAAWTPRLPGVYAVDIVVTGAAPDGTPVERTGLLAVEVQPQPTQGLIRRNLALVIGAVVFALILLLAVMVGFFWLIARLVRRKR